MWNKTVSICKDARHILVVVLLVAVIFQIVHLPQIVSQNINQRLDRLEEGLTATNSHVNGVLTASEKLIANVNASAEDNYWEMKAQANTMTVILKDTSDLIRDFRAHLFGGRDTQGTDITGLVTEARGLLADGRALTRSLQYDLHEVMTTANQDLKTLDTALANIAQLIATLDRQVEDGSPLAQQTVISLNKAIEDFDKLLTNEDIMATLEHVHGSMESVDIMMRPWRERASALKTIIQKAIGLFKITWSL